MKASLNLNQAVHKNLWPPSNLCSKQFSYSLQSPSPMTCHCDGSGRAVMPKHCTFIFSLSLSLSSDQPLRSNFGHWPEDISAKMPTGSAITHADLEPSRGRTDLGSSTGTALVIWTILCGLFSFVLCLIAEATHSQVPPS